MIYTKDFIRDSIIVGCLYIVLAVLFAHHLVDDMSGVFTAVPATIVLVYIWNRIKRKSS